MLVKFDSEVGSFTIGGDIAVQLLKAMGHSGTVPSAILPVDIPPALARLKAAVAASPANKSNSSDEEPGKGQISLRQRAFPLIELLTHAAKNGVEVMWT